MYLCLTGRTTGRSIVNFLENHLIHAPAMTSQTSKLYTVRIGYRVTGYNDLPGIMIGLTKIKIKTSKGHSKYHYIQCISAVVILMPKTIGNRKRDCA